MDTIAKKNKKKYIWQQLIIQLRPVSDFNYKQQRKHNDIIHKKKITFQSTIQIYILANESSIENQ